MIATNKNRENPKKSTNNAMSNDGSRIKIIDQSQGWGDPKSLRMCLHNIWMVPKPLRSGQQCFTSGWGHTSVDGTPGTILKAVKMKIKEPIHCRKGILYS